MTRIRASVALLLVSLATPAAAAEEAAEGKELHVGPGRAYATPAGALKAANDGETILIHPRSDGRAYQRVALYVTQKRLTIRAAREPGQPRVVLSGKGFNYSGRGRTPRAIVQFNRGADGCVLEGFELTGAGNRTHNGAGVRINQANGVTVRDCEIHRNDMGAMSNGNRTGRAGADQRFVGCVFHHNGNHEDPGYNHNLYLGGAGVTLLFCEVHTSLTGHNIKSRAHVTRVLYSYVHDSANREFDLVDSQETERPGSDAVLVGNLIVKDPECKGNRAVIHFGRDGKRGHDGTLHLIHNTIVTPFVSPVVELSADRADANLLGNLVWGAGARRRGQRIARFRNGAAPAGLRGVYNAFGRAFGVPDGAGLHRAKNAFSLPAKGLFVAPGERDYRLAGRHAGKLLSPIAAGQVRVPRPGGGKTPGGDASGPGRRGKPPEQPRPDRSGAAAAAVTVPPGGAALLWQYRHPAGGQKRPDRDANRPALGAFGVDR